MNIKETAWKIAQYIFLVLFLCLLAAILYAAQRLRS